jgi:hypothetical protein
MFLHVPATAGCGLGPNCPCMLATAILRTVSGERLYSAVLGEPDKPVEKSLPRRPDLAAGRNNALVSTPRSAPMSSFDDIDFFLRA